MKAIILAAGMGTRLGKYTENLPKGMLEFKGKSLLMHQVETLRAVGISDIIIVTGYHPEKITIQGVTFYHNPDFATTNMVETLFCAEEVMTDDTLVLYSDLLYEKKTLEGVLESSVDIGVAVDPDYWEYWQARMDEPEKDVESLVIDSEGKIVELGDTTCGLEKAKIRYVGMIKFSKKALQAAQTIYHKNKKEFYDIDIPWLRSKSFKKAYMTSLLQALINEGHRVDPIYISHGWIEFDTVEDYERVIVWDKEGTLKRFIKID